MGGAIWLADGVFCLSQADEAYLERRLRVPPERITRFANGVGAERFSTPGAERGQRVGHRSVDRVGL